ncbi:hypothetical protein D3C84_595610 [compost metagenome]
MKRSASSMEQSTSMEWSMIRWFCNCNRAWCCRLSSSSRLLSRSRWLRSMARRESRWLITRKKVKPSPKSMNSGGR